MRSVGRSADGAVRTKLRVRGREPPMKIVRTIAIAVVVYIALGLTFDAVIGRFQPQMERTAVLRTFDASGQPRETVVSLLDDGGQLWVESGHWFRGWYRRAVAHPSVEVI